MLKDVIHEPVGMAGLGYSPCCFGSGRPTLFA
jgi:hypothetical protein